MIRIYPFLMLLFVILLTGCNQVPGLNHQASIPENFDYGKIKDNVYSNDYFNCSMKLPATWAIQSEEALNEMSEAGKKLFAGDDKAVQQQLDIASIKTANLLAAFKYPIDSITGEFNPSIILIAENVSLANLETGKEYLKASQQVLKRSNIEYEFAADEFERHDISGREFYSFTAKMHVSDDIQISQDFFSTIIKGFSFNVIVTYFDEQSKKELYDVMKTLKFKKIVE